MEIVSLFSIFFLLLPLSMVQGSQISNDPMSQTKQVNSRYSFPEDAEITLDTKNGNIRFLKGKDLSHELESDIYFRKLQEKGIYDKIAIVYIEAHKKDFKLKSPLEELVTENIQTDNLGFKHIKLQQVYKGIPILDAEMIIHLNQSNQIYLIQAHSIPTPTNLNVQTTLDQDTAFRLAKKSVNISGPARDICNAILIIFVSESGKVSLAYKTIVGNLFQGWIVIVDAHTGEVITKRSTLISKDHGGVFHKD
jgi:Zn-dependent metalloprotease